MSIERHSNARGGLWSNFVWHFCCCRCSSCTFELQFLILFFWSKQFKIQMSISCGIIYSRFFFGKTLKLLKIPHTLTHTSKNEWSLLRICDSRGSRNLIKNLSKKKEKFQFLDHTHNFFLFCFIPLNALVRSFIQKMCQCLTLSLIAQNAKCIKSWFY